MQKAGQSKEVVVAIKPNTSHYHIYFKTGGELPEQLSGLFVRKQDAEQAIACWKAKKDYNKVTPKAAKVAKSK